MRSFALFLGLLLNLMLYAGGAALGGWHAWQTMAALFVLNFVAILIHELGHAIAYWRIGGTVSVIAVLFLRYDVARRRFTRSRMAPGGDVGGYVAGRYPGNNPTVRQVLLVAGGGPAANLLTGAAAGIAAWLWTEPAIERFFPVAPDQGSTMAEVRLDQVDAYMNALWWYDLNHTALALFAILSIGFALLNLLPYGGSDGQKIFQALKMRRLSRPR